MRAVVHPGREAKRVEHPNLERRVVLASEELRGPLRIDHGALRIVHPQREPRSRQQRVRQGRSIGTLNQSLRLPQRVTCVVQVRWKVGHHDRQCIPAQKHQTLVHTRVGAQILAQRRRLSVGLSSGTCVDQSQRVTGVGLALQLPLAAPPGKLPRARE